MNERKKKLIIIVSAVFIAAAVVSYIALKDGDGRDEENESAVRSREKIELVEIGAESASADSGSKREGDFTVTDIGLVFSSNDDMYEVEVEERGLYSDLFGKTEFSDTEPAELNEWDPIFTLTADDGTDTHTFEVYYGGIVRTERLSARKEYAPLDDSERSRMIGLVMKTVIKKEFLPEGASNGTALSQQSDMFSDTEKILSDGEYYESVQIEDSKGKSDYFTARAGDYLSYNESLVKNESDIEPYSLICRGSTGYKSSDFGETYERTDVSVDDKRKTFAQTLTESCEYDGGFTFSGAGEGFICEKYTAGDYAFYYTLINDAGKISGVLCYNGIYFTFIRDYELTDQCGYCSLEDLKKSFEAAKESCADDSNPTEIADGVFFNAENRFDFEAEKVEGEEIENPHIVESYRDFFDTAEEFTIRITSDRDDYLTEIYATQSKDGYYRKNTSRSGTDEPIISEELYVGGDYYMRCCSYSVSLDYTKYPMDEYTSERVYVTSIIQRSAIYPDEDTFVRAYNVTVGGEDYICEVWHAGETDFKFYCKGEEIIAYEAEYGIGTENGVIETLEEKADKKQIKAPESYTDIKDYE